MRIAKKLNQNVCRGLFWMENGENLYAKKGRAVFRGIKGVDGLSVGMAEKETSALFYHAIEPGAKCISVGKGDVKRAKENGEKEIHIGKGTVDVSDMSRTFTLFRVDYLRFFTVDDGIIADVDGRRAVRIAYIKADKPEHKTETKAEKPETKTEHKTTAKKAESPKHTEHKTEKPETEKQATPLSPEWFEGCKGSKSVREKYISLARRFHPDNSAGNADIFANIAKAYELALAKGKVYDLEHENDVQGYIPKKTALTDDEKQKIFDREFKAACNVVAALPAHCEVELCGIYLWVHNTRKEDKDARALMKSNGFFWASKKLAWYWKPSFYKSWGRKGGQSMGNIRMKYGSKTLKAASDDEKQA